MTPEQRMLEYIHKRISETPEWKEFMKKKSFELFAHGDSVTTSEELAEVANKIAARMNNEETT